MNDLTSIVVIIRFVHSSNVDIFFFFKIIIYNPCVVFTVRIICCTDVAELMAASARHVVTAFILLDPELAS